MVNFRMNGFYAAEIVNKQVFLKVRGQSCGFCFCFFLIDIFITQIMPIFNNSFQRQRIFPVFKLVFK